MSATGGEPPSREEYERAQRYVYVAQFYDSHEADTEEHVFESLARFLIDDLDMGECASLYVSRVDDSFLRLAAHAGAPEPPQSMRELSKGVNTVVGRCLHSMRSQLIEDCRTLHSRLPDEPEFGSVLCTPMTSGGECVGAIWVYSSEHAYFSVADQRLLETLGGLAATIITRIRALARAEHNATHNFKTGLLNEAGLRLALEAMTLPSGRPRALIFIDIDKFKRFNSRGFQEHGDRVIRTVGLQLQGWVTGSGMVSHWGGDEFVALVGIEEAELLPFCNNIIRSLADATGSDHVSVSMGIAWWDQDPFETALSRADQALRVAKVAGRGRAVISSPNMRKLHLSLFRRILSRRQF